MNPNPERPHFTGGDFPEAQKGKQWVCGSILVTEPEPRPSILLLNNPISPLGLRCFQYYDSPDEANGLSPVGVFITPFLLDGLTGYHLQVSLLNTSTPL